MFATPFHAYYTARILDGLSDEDKFIPAFASSDIRVYPYQVSAALFAVRSPYNKGVVLMDESGLGKSTEAMLVVTQKWYEGKTRILIVVPNSDLLVQWENLIENKYSIPYITIASAKELETAEGTFNHDAVVLTTFDFASQYSDVLRETIWDVTVVEEASLLSSGYKDETSRGATLKRIAEGSFKVLLTGTPIEKNILDLYGLMYFIDETILPSEQEYMAKYFRKPENYPELAKLVGKYCFRTLRKQAKRCAFIPERIVITCEFEQSEKEQKLYDLIQNYIDKPNKVAFPEMEKYDLALMLFGAMGSSTPAIIKSIEGVIKRLEKIPGADEELKEFTEMLLAAHLIKTDTKLKLLIEYIEELFKLLKKAGANRKAVIFTESRETQSYLAENLKDKYKLSIYNGSKDYREIESFKTENEIIISTDQGSRGFNMEDAALVINYDLLYNTLKMEQRIDRCHRLNQQNDVIVLNFLNKSNMADVRKLELVNKRMLVADGVFGMSDNILGGFTDNLKKTLKEITVRTQAQIKADYNKTLEYYEDDNRQQVGSAEEILFTTFTKELADKVKITPEYVDLRTEQVNNDLWKLVKYYFEQYNEKYDDCKFVINEEKRTVTATDYSELPYLFYYWTGGQNKRYRALKEFKKITLLSPLAKGIVHNMECSDEGKLTVDGDVEPCKIALYTIDILAGRKRTGQVYTLLCGITDDGKTLTNNECLKILEMPVVDYEESGKRLEAWLKSSNKSQMDNLIPLEELIKKSVEDTSSAQAEEIERIKQRATVNKNLLDHELVDLKSELAKLEKQLEGSTANRLERLKLERKLGEAKQKLMAKEESIYFDAMRFDIACEENIKKFLEDEKITARMQKHFEIEVKGKEM
ncbi:MAG: DEAD/DEAH box helicase [Eubacteriales bacterium]|nr:DEAD/DEAH box helicase [Eubacteriales bacterium]